VETNRTHEFHDNVLGQGGGLMDKAAIHGHATNVTVDSQSGNIIGFDILATIWNDTFYTEPTWLAGNNSHSEQASLELPYHGSLLDLKLTAEFAVQAGLLPPSGIPYQDVQPYIEALNHDQLAWFCWTPGNPEQNLVPYGAYSVPTWDFGDLAQGASVSRLLQFAVSAPGISPADPRYNVILESEATGADLLLNRTTSLKVSTWLDLLSLDTGITYPVPPDRASDVSVFHNLPAPQPELDFGDAKDPTYPTLLASGGARHQLDGVTYLGQTVDPEADGQPDGNALGDDQNGTPDDEDGVRFLSLLIPGQPALVRVVTSTAGFFNLWIDYNADGSWAETSDHVFTDQLVPAGVNTLPFVVPASASSFISTFARFRFCTQQGVTYAGLAPDGEVEDYLVQISDDEPYNDLGDAPDSSNTPDVPMTAYPGVPANFPTVDLAGSPPHGPVHRNPGTYAWLGQSVTLENEADSGPDQDPSNNILPAVDVADRDGADDCTVNVGKIQLPHCVPTRIRYEVTVAVAGTYYFNGWCDWNRDGDWNDLIDCGGQNADEWIIHNQVLTYSTPGTYIVESPSFLSWHPTPVGAEPPPMWARLMLADISWDSAWGAGGAGSPNGFDAGETEDYYVDNITTEQPLSELCPKWVQYPACDQGRDWQSWTLYQDLNGPYPKHADDWLCDGRPVKGLTWWGSYLQWMSDDSTTNVPPPGAPIRPQGFYITWYTDVPVGSDPFSHPGTAVVTNYYPLEAYSQTQIVEGLVFEQPVCVSYLPEGYWEHEYRYYLRFPDGEEWNEKEDHVYWLSIQAVYPNPPGVFPWGWLETYEIWRWNDRAVVGAAGAQPEWIPTDFDLSFSLLTEVCPSRCKKWEQGPDMVTGENMQSFTWEDLPGFPLLADDFISDGRPITDIHWWGSYLNWMELEPGGETPVPPPPIPDQPLGFKLSWHPDDGGTPGLPYTNIFVTIDRCHETYYGSVLQDWKVPPIFEHEYQYYVDLLDPEILEMGAWMETNGGHYWLNIQALMNPAWIPGQSHNGWGWKITTNVTEYPAQVSVDNGLSWITMLLPPNHPLGPIPMDLSFELTTADIATSGAYVVEAVFTNIYLPSGHVLPMVTRGYGGCGKQILQRSTNLVHGEAGWVDVNTNLYPRQENWWVQPPSYTAVNYRVRSAK